MEKGILQIYTGHGKGKTSAALGLGIRAAGRGLKIVMIQFLKGGDTGEEMFLKNIPGSFRIYRFKPVKKFLSAMNEEEKKLVIEETSKGFDLAGDLLAKEACDVLILDEFFGALNNRLVDPERAKRIVHSRPGTMELVLTGRDAPADYLEMADLVTEMKCLKHPLQQGITARTGIER